MFYIFFTKKCSIAKKIIDNNVKIRLFLKYNNLFWSKKMKRVKFDSRIDDVDTISDALLRLYKDKIAQNKDGKIAADQNKAEIMAEIEDLSARITSASHRVKKSTSLKNENTVRDTLVRQLEKILIGYANSPLENLSVPAKKLLSAFNKYGVAILRERQLRKSSLIASMLDGLDPLKDEIAALPGVFEVIKSLHEAQNTFNSLVDTYAAVKSEKGESASELKSKLLDAINEKLVPYMTAMSKLNKEFAELEAKYDVIISQAKTSSTKKKASASKDASAQPAFDDSSAEEHAVFDVFHSFAHKNVLNGMYKAQNWQTKHILAGTDWRYAFVLLSIRFVFGTYFIFSA